MVRQRIFGLINTFLFAFFAVFGLLALLENYKEAGEVNTTYLIVVFVFLLLTILDVILVFRAPYSKGARIGLLILGIVCVPSVLFGIFNILSYKYAQDLYETGEIQSHRPHFRANHKYRKERARHDRTYRKFMRGLRRRKFRALAKSFLLLFTSALHSFVGIAILIDILVGILEWNVLLVVGIVVVMYIFLCGFEMAAKEISAGSTVNYTKRTTTKGYYYEEAGLFKEEGFHEYTKSVKDEKKSIFIFSLPAILYFLCGWFIVAIQLLGFIFTLFIPYDSERLSLLPPSKIPSQYRFSLKWSRLFYFFLGFTPVYEGYLDSIEP